MGLSEFNSLLFYNYTNINYNYTNISLLNISEVK